MKKINESWSNPRKNPQINGKKWSSIESVTVLLLESSIIKKLISKIEKEKPCNLWNYNHKIIMTIVRMVLLLSNLSCVDAHYQLIIYTPTCF